MESCDCFLEKLFQDTMCILISHWESNLKIKFANMFGITYKGDSAQEAGYSIR